VTVKRIIGGPRSCSGLSPLGVEQAERLRDRLRRTGELKIDVLMSSSMPRARETADIVAAGIGSTPPVVSDDWREHDPGDCDGMSFTDYFERYGMPTPGLDTVTFPGGETLRQFHTRVSNAFEGLLADYPDQTVMLVCHGGVIDAVLRRVLGVAEFGLIELPTTNTSITEISQRGDLWRLQRYNDAAHLEGLPLETPTSRS
jgi:probable phosphoglycerate mutase